MEKTKKKLDCILLIDDDYATNFINKKKPMSKEALFEITETYFPTLIEMGVL